MTIADFPAQSATELSLAATESTSTRVTVEGLQTVIFGPHSALYARVRDVVVALADLPGSERTYREETELAPDLLRAAIAGLGRPGHEIAADTWLRGALCDWAQVASPRLLLVLTGHFDLAIGAILALGNGSEYQQRCLAELDTGAALGVLALTELGGTNGADQQTRATWDSATGGFVLTTPSAQSAKFMPNVADSRTPKIAVVTARLIVDGRDEGVLPFLVWLRTADGAVADGVEIVRLPDKPGAPMDHAMIRFRDKDNDRVWLPREALLGGTWARMSEDGRLHCELEPRQRFHAAISVLGNGRLDLATAAIASARAAIAGLANYSRQRQPGDKRMSERDAVQLDLVRTLPATYAATVLGRRVRQMRAESVEPDAVQSLWSMLVKPLLSNAAKQVLSVMRERAAAQGAFRANYLVDWIENLEAIITAEGENQIMQVTAGKSKLDLTALQLPDTPALLPWYLKLLIKREDVIAVALRSRCYEPAGVVLGRDSAAIELASATAERLAATALLAEAAAATDPVAKGLIESMAAAYALGCIEARGNWYNAQQLLSPRMAGTVMHELVGQYRILVGGAPLLIEAFNTPHLSGAPMFAADYIEAWKAYAGWDDTTFR
ncbi:acyl-CoA dehydrogenase family protein [Nocardia sp. XZ_19_369]|uniref:acyl-CoA dehydrogenase family protein n=1 Tax=Nocardia sp. XZ_19_369 TaxID=2769487 RepID=UPI0018904714|nr:acyl-CoA dehydrogenase family protein [Nocardia sp. XZ_19_369]